MPPALLNWSGATPALQGEMVHTEAGAGCRPGAAVLACGPTPPPKDYSATGQVAQAAHLVQMQQDSGFQLVEAALPLLLELHDLVPDGLQPGWAGLPDVNSEAPLGLARLIQVRACGDYSAACSCVPDSVSSRLKQSTLRLPSPRCPALRQGPMSSQPRQLCSAKTLCNPVTVMMQRLQIWAAIIRATPFRASHMLPLYCHTLFLTPARTSQTQCRAYSHQLPSLNYTQTSLHCWTAPAACQRKTAALSFQRAQSRPEVQPHSTAQACSSALRGGLASSTVRGHSPASQRPPSTHGCPPASQILPDPKPTAQRIGPSHHNTLREVHRARQSQTTLALTLRPCSMTLCFLTRTSRSFLRPSTSLLTSAALSSLSWRPSRSSSTCSRGSALVTSVKVGGLRRQLSGGEIGSA